MTLHEDARTAFAGWRDEVRQNFFTRDAHLQSLLRHYGREACAPELERFGAACVEIDALAHENNRDENLPRLRRYDDHGRRIERVDFHGTHHRIGKLAYGTGALGRYRERGREFETLSLTYLLGLNGEAGHACPIACTAGAIKLLRLHGERFRPWLERLFDPDYDTHFHGAQFLTEVQGGADVGSNVVEARPTERPGWVRLYGEKWFCSVVDAHMMVVTARPTGAGPGTAGLRAYAVPRFREDGRINGFGIRRLKFKLGTRSMASGEIDFEGAEGVEIGDFKDTMTQVINTSRLYNALIGAGLIERGYREAHAYARHRRAFGVPIAQMPAVARTIARIRCEAYAARASSFFLADLADRIDLAGADAAPSEVALYRMLVNLNKFWCSYVGTSAIRDAIEILGGNGAIEEFSVLPRLLRDSIVCEQWEGPHNVLCAQLLRDASKRQLHRPLFDHLAVLSSQVGGETASALAELRGLWDRLLELPELTALGTVRQVVERTRRPVQSLLLSLEARRPGSDPLLPTVAEHLLRGEEGGPDRLGDSGLIDRVLLLVR